MTWDFKLIRRTPSDIRDEITSEWLPLLDDFLPADHYPIVLNRYFKDADVNMTKVEGDWKWVNIAKPDFRIFYGHQKWNYLPIVPDKKRHGKAYKHIVKNYDQYPIVQRQLGIVVNALNDKNWAGVAKEVLELFCKSNGKKAPNEDVPTEQILLLQPEHGFFLVRNQHEKGEFVVLDLFGEHCRNDLYTTGTEYDIGIRDYSFTRHRSMNWESSYERNLLGLLSEPQSNQEDIAARIRKDLNWEFGSHYSDAINPLLQFAISKLERFGEHVAIAASQSRFNDAGNDENWMSVHLGDYSWNNGSYFGNPIEKHRDMPDEARIMLGILTQLNAAGLPHKFQQSIGYTFEPMDVWVIIRQGEKWLFAFSSSNGYNGAVYDIDPSSGELNFIGLASRFDWGLPSLHWITVNQWLEDLQSGEAFIDFEKSIDLDIVYRDLLPDD